MAKGKHKSAAALEEPRGDWWGARFFAGGKPGDKARTERQWWLDQLKDDVPAGWAAQAFKRWFTPSAARKAVEGQEPAAQAYRDWCESAQSEEGKDNGQEA